MCRSSLHIQGNIILYLAAFGNAFPRLSLGFEFSYTVLLCKLFQCSHTYHFLMDTGFGNIIRKGIVIRLNL